jgi:16S rRNA (guanine966-N2)-methyltransferase
MSAIAPELEGARVLDLFAGSGALGLEALSRGALHVTFVESASSVIRVLKRNLDDLQAPAGAVRVVRGDAIRFVERAQRLAYDLALADPPYREGLATRLAGVFEVRPFARLLCIEHAPDEPLSGTEPVRQRRYGDTVLSFLAAP